MSKYLDDLLANTEGSGKTPRREQRDLGILINEDEGVLRTIPNRKV